jgi:hypothetical protein
VHGADRAVQHLLTVARELDSMTVGESQILGRCAARWSRQAHCMLNAARPAFTLNGGPETVYAITAVQARPAELARIARGHGESRTS